MAGCHRPAPEQAARPGAVDGPGRAAARLVGRRQGPGAHQRPARPTRPLPPCRRRRSIPRRWPCAAWPGPRRPSWRLSRRHRPRRPAPKGPAPQAPEFKPEELQALESFERALDRERRTSSREPGPRRPPGSPFPEALRAPPARRPARAAGKAEQATQPPPRRGPDFRPERVIQAYRAAIQGDPAAKGAVERLVDFATRVGRVDDVDQALQELLRRDKEKPEPLVRYGDFLLNQRKDAAGGDRAVPAGAHLEAGRQRHAREDRRHLHRAGDRPLRQEPVRRGRGAPSRRPEVRGGPAVAARA